MNLGIFSKDVRINQVERVVIVMEAEVQMLNIKSDSGSVKENKTNMKKLNYDIKDKKKNVADT